MPFFSEVTSCGLIKISVIIYHIHKNIEKLYNVNKLHEVQSPEESFYSLIKL